MNSAGILLFIFFVALLFNAFFAGYETGFVSCNPIRVRHLAQKKNHPNAKRLLNYLNQPDRMIILVLLGTNLAMIAATIAVTRLTRDLGPLWASLIVTPAILVFGEIVPKSMFRSHPTRLSLAFTSVIYFFDRMFAPVVVPIAWILQRFLAFKKNDRQGMRVLMRSPEDMRVLVDESADRGAIAQEEKEMIHSVMDLQKQYAKEVMVPRIDIQALPEDATKNELEAFLMDCGYTRVPIYRDTVDEIIGAINAFDILKDTQPENPDIQRFIRPVMHVTDTMPLDDLLQAMRDEKQSMAIVMDEYGGTDGLVTLEDILEEIFGEIHDEYDDEAPSIRKTGPNTYVIETRMPLEDAADYLGIEISDEDVETVGGWVMHLARCIPQKGDVIDYGRFRITVLEGGPSFIATIRLEIRPLGGAASSETNSKPAR